MLKTPLTGVDRSTSFTLTFSETLQAQAVLTCNINAASPNPGASISYRGGTITIEAPIPVSTSFTVQYYDKPGSGNVIREATRKFSYEGGGWHFEADEVARCVRDGKLESDIWGHDKSLLLMDVFDEVRSCWGLFPCRFADDCPRFAVKVDIYSRKVLRRLCECHTT